jgi:hypothetical protein
MTLPLDELVATPALVNQRAQALGWDELLFEYELALDDAQALLGGLSEAQIHFKSSDKDYSIAETVTHAAHCDEFLFGWLKQLSAGQAPDQANWRDMTHGAQNDLMLDAVQGTVETCRTLARTVIADLPEPCNLELTASHPYFGALNVKGWLYFLSVHRGTHLRQCEQVIDTPGFPRSDSAQSLSPEEYLQPSPRKTWLEHNAAGKKQAAKGKKQAASGKRQAAGSKQLGTSGARRTSKRKK